jgi:hypothetical protein
MRKLNAFFAFILLSLSINAQTAFMGDVTDYGYINRFAFTQVVSTYKEQDKTPRVIIYSFGENNKLVEKKEQQGKRTMAWSYKYDHNWNILETRKTINEELVSIEKCAYDTANRLSQSTLFRVEEKDSLTETIQWLDANTRHSKHFDGFKEVLTMTIFDEKKRPINEVKIDGSGCEWAYVDDLLVMRKAKGANNTLKDIDRYDFDNENRIRSIENSQVQRTFHYDNSGLLTKIQVFDDNGLMIGWEKFEYVFPNK